MQNISNLSYIKQSKVINIKSELLCREAEDDFFYFNKINDAYKKLIKAIELTPFHLKSLILLADISFIKGFTKKALDLYLKAENISTYNAKIPASIANCYYVLGNFDKSLKYCEKAISMLNNENFMLFSQIFEIKINILIQEKKYKQAYIEFIKSQNLLDNSYLKTIHNINYEILNEKITLHKKIRHSKLKIV